MRFNQTFRIAAEADTAIVKCLLRGEPITSISRKDATTITGVIQASDEKTARQKVRQVRSVLRDAGLLTRGRPAGYRKTAPVELVIVDGKKRRAPREWAPAPPYARAV